MLNKQDILKNKLFIDESNKNLIEPITNKVYFKYEYENLKNFNNTSSIRGVKTYKFTTLLNQIYEQNGVKVWET